MRSAGLQMMLKELGSSSPLSLDGAASNSATIRHDSPRRRTARPTSALEQRNKKDSFAVSSIPEDFKQGANKNNTWKIGGNHFHSSSGKVRPASAEGFFKGQRMPVRMTMPSSPLLFPISLPFTQCWTRTAH